MNILDNAIKYTPGGGKVDINLTRENNFAHIKVSDTGNGKLSKFDKASNTKVEEFLKKPDSRLQVVVTAEPEGKELGLVSIENQE